MKKLFHCDDSVVYWDDSTGRRNLQSTVAGMHGKHNFLYFQKHRKVNEKCASLPQALRSEVLKSIMYDIQIECKDHEYSYHPAAVEGGEVPADPQT